MLKQLYKTAQTTSSATLKSQAMDISALFTEKSLQIANAGAVIALILPNKLFYAPSYEPFRQYISKHAVKISSTDWTHKKTFDACTYPADLILQKIETRPRSLDAWSNNAEACRIEIESPNPFCRAFLPEQLTINEFFNPKLGLRTGANDIFICDVINQNYNNNTSIVSFNHSDNNTSIESNMLFPILRGTDIRPFNFNTNKCMLWPQNMIKLMNHTPSFPPLTTEWLNKIPHPKLRHTNANQTVLMNLCKMHPSILKPKVVWRDIAKELSAVYINDPNILCLNTTYYINVNDDETGFLLSGFLNSSPIRQFAFANAEHAKNNYRRFLAWLIKSIPWPFNKNNEGAAKKIISISIEAHKNKAITPKQQAALDNAVITAIANMHVAS